MLWHAPFAAALFGLGALADFKDGTILARGGGSALLEERMAAMVEDSLRSLDVVPHGPGGRRATSSSVTLDSTLNATDWEVQLESACVSALSQLAQSTNPSGTCTCYNLLGLDNQTGVFEADLRLYQVSDARGTFAGIAAKDVNVSLSYADATVSSMSNLTSTTSSAKRNIFARSSPSLLKSYLFIGQINSNKMTTNLTMAQLETLVTPIVTLSATGSSGTVTTNVSMNEAAFVAGTFSDQVVMSPLALAEAAVDLETEGLTNGTVAFVLPGVQLILFPIGLIVISVWTVVGGAFIAFGTYERMHYAAEYQRQTSMVGRAPSKRI